ncbi:vitronectin b isoform X1 [Chanos chanos]|uniref:Vitronectin b isoform X1 n=1 Tax=Chanos chanos TaxID=29144 RepID=A0A6J2W725_CHACN|nr:vitronectin-like isoform X1 [Chanos chanos]
MRRTRTGGLQQYLIHQDKMKFLLISLSLLLVTVFAAEESCEHRCQSGFDPNKKCQCDIMCKYYGSCCQDFDTTCRKKTRGDTFADSEVEEQQFLTMSTTESATTVAPTQRTTAPATTTHGPTPPLDPDAVTCSGRTFDAFLQLKNGSIYAFRGEYFFEMDERSVVPGYPKLIKDVWGIPGPIDAAFTRINCQGKTYIFKGNKYWRFDNDVLDEDYPRDISVGFEKMPDDIDAAFAIPAPGHHGKEKVYFFKGDQYYQYEFKHQPSHEECIQMTKSAPSVLFSRYTDTYCDYDLGDLLSSLFFDFQGHHKGPRFISKDWVGIKPPVDAAMVGRLYMSPVPSPTPETDSGPIRRPARRRRKGRRRKSRSPFWDFVLDYEDGYHGARSRKKGQKKGRGKRPETLYEYDLFPDSLEYTDMDLPQEKAMPVQNVYFFKRDKYYRVDLQTKRIDYANPPYPRSIAKYWLGCKEKDLAEKR